MTGDAMIADRAATPPDEVDVRGGSATSSGLGRAAPFVLGASAGVFVNLGGQLYVAEIALIVALPWVLHRYGLPGRALTSVCICTGVALIGLLLSGMSGGAATSSVISALVSSVVFLLGVVVVGLSFETWSHYVRCFLGLVLGYLITTVLQPDMFFAGSPWKFGYALPVTVALVVLCTRIRATWLRVVLLLALALLNVLGDYRSLAVIVLLTVLTNVWLDSPRRRALSGRHPARAISAFVVAAAFVGVGVAQLYTTLVQQRILGAAAAYRLQLQGGGSPLLMLLGGRNEIFYSLPAALTHPILGWGADPIAPTWVLDTGRRSLFDLGLVEIASNEPVDGTIPMHSFVMSSWIEAGALGLPIWILTVVIVLRAQRHIFVMTPQRSLLPTFLSLLLIWNLLFSPFGGQTRFFTAVCVAFLLFLSGELRGSQDRPAVSELHTGTSTLE